VKRRLIKLSGKRATQDGILIIEARRHRTQEQNRNEATERFRKLILKALEKPKARKRTQPTNASQEDRLRRKKRRGAIKHMREEKFLDKE
jgi:ribosome-associated protein